MLLFILTHFLQKANFSIFKYISCYCLSSHSVVHSKQWKIQIHLMLLFIQRQPQNGAHCLQIQIHLMLLFIGITASNVHIPFGIQIHLMLLFILRCSVIWEQTKHIQIHLMLLFILLFLCISGTHDRFKYISCYCLSVFIFIYSFLFFIFKYISCYCLSRGCFLSYIPLENSNTSHVIVYRKAELLRKTLFHIQIHLMLLFIWLWMLQTIL